jgi:uracil-DNA glycosylase family 4
MSILNNFRQLSKTCEKCDLCKTRKNVCISKGKESAQYVFLGEAPGFSEDKHGEPFVGDSGQILRKLMFEAGFNPEEVFITNLVRCRPPNNRNPKKDEIASCIEWLKQELHVLEPKVIIPLGRIPTYNVLKLYGQKVKSNLKLEDYLDNPIVITDPIFHANSVFIQPVYHPSFLLRNGNKKNQKVIDAFKRIINL